MPQPDTYPDGTPCWTDLTTPDLEASRAFYGPLLGWQFQDRGEQYRHYTMCRVDGKSVAALMAQPPDREGMGAAWNVHFACSDVDTVYSEVGAGGGKQAFGPADVPDTGRMACALDPAGAPFGLWQGREYRGAELIGEVGSLCWVELETPDGAGADTFYRRLFPYTQEQIGDGRDFDYTVWKVPGSDAPVCGRHHKAVAGPRWSVCFAVADADAAAAGVRQLGGRVLDGPFESPYGRMVRVQDPSGADMTLCRRP